jgi:hypothetical protein
VIPPSLPPSLQLVGLYADKGLAAICMPTDQGDYEPDDSTTIRIKVQQQFGMPSSSKGPIVVADKTDSKAARVYSLRASS